MSLLRAEVKQVRDDVQIIQTEMPALKEARAIQMRAILVAAGLVGLAVVGLVIKSGVHP